MVAGAAMLIASAALAQTGAPAQGTAYACAASAITVRETAIVAAWDAQHDAVKTAFQNRSASLGAAWALTDKKARRTAIKAAWDQNRKDAKAARDAWKTARQNAWNAFKTARTACGPNLAGEDGTTSAADNQL